MSDENPTLPPPSEAPLAEVPLRTSEDHTWALILHLSALLHLLGGTFPGVNVVGPLIIWLWKRTESPYLDEVGKRVLNFQISWAIYFLVLYSAIAVLVWVLIGFILIPLAAIAAIAWIVITVIGAIRESNGQAYRFPASIQFLK